MLFLYLVFLKLILPLLNLNKNEIIKSKKLIKFKNIKNLIFLKNYFFMVKLPELALFLCLLLIISHSPLAIIATINLIFLRHQKLLKA